MEILYLIDCLLLGGTGISSKADLPIEQLQVFHYLRLTSYTTSVLQKRSKNSRVTMEDSMISRGS